MKGKALEERALMREQMKAYKAEGHTMKEVAEKYGYTIGYVKKICRGIEPQQATKETLRNQYTNGVFDREANAIRYINERTPNFEYAGNFTGVDGYVDLKCKTCGTVITRSFVSVKHGTARCDICWRNELNALKEQKVTERKEAVKEQRRRQKYKRLFEAEIVQLEFPSCNCCGQLYVPRKQGVKYCSAECMSRANNAIHKDRRVRRLKKIVVDSDITLERLYERDKGVCYMCGCMCDWEDYEVRPDGTFIAHDNYPSIDHIQPISKGGLHSWDNVRLACRKCNYQKSAAYLPGA